MGVGRGDLGIGKNVEEDWSYVAFVGISTAAVAVRFLVVEDDCVAPAQAGAVMQDLPLQARFLLAAAVQTVIRSIICDERSLTGISKDSQAKYKTDQRLHFLQQIRSNSPC